MAAKVSESFDPAFGTVLALISSVSMSETRRHCPHDRLVKWVLSRTDAAAIQLRHVLPSVVRARVDWTSLSATATSHIDPTLGERLGDVVWSMALADAGTRSELLVPIEHQSTPELEMAWRFLTQTHGLWRHHRQRGGRLRMPMVLPVVLYQGARPWAPPRRLSESLDVPESIRARFSSPIELRYIVDSLEGTVLDDPLGSDGAIALLEATRMLLRWSRRPAEINEDRVAWLAQLLECVMDELGRDELVALYTYVISAFPSDSTLRRPLLETLRPSMQRMFFSIYDEAIAKGTAIGHARGEAVGLAKGEAVGLAKGEAVGLAKGEAVGLARGEARGRLAAQVELLLKVLDRRALRPTPSQRRRIVSSTDPRLLEMWFDRALTAGTVDEVLAT